MRQSPTPSTDTAKPYGPLTQETFYSQTFGKRLAVWLLVLQGSNQLKKLQDLIDTAAQQYKNQGYVGTPDMQPVEKLLQSENLLAGCLQLLQEDPYSTYSLSGWSYTSFASYFIQTVAQQTIALQEAQDAKKVSSDDETVVVDEPSDNRRAFNFFTQNAKVGDHLQEISQGMQAHLASQLGA